MDIGFKGKVALITGAGAGLGRIYALDFVKRGGMVVINDINNPYDVLMEIDEMGGQGMASEADITSLDQIQDMVDRTMDRFGRIDVLINNAGIGGDKSFGNLTAGDSANITNVHLRGTIRTTRVIWPIMMRQAYGRIVVTTSASGLYGASGQAPYSAAKMGVVGLINSLAQEGQKYNIRANALAPVAYTEATSSLYPPEAEEFMKPEQVSAGMMFLCSERAPNGAVLCAGGGAFTKAEVMESQGISLEPSEVTPEAVANNWERIADMTGARTHSTAGDQLGKFFAMAKR